MALNIKNDEVVQLAEEISRLTGESKTEVIRKALLDRKKNLNIQMFFIDRKKRLVDFLEQEVWSQIPKKLSGQKTSKKEIESILGYGKDGV